MQQRFFEEVAAKIEALPPVAGATICGGTPPTGGGVSFDLQFEIDGRGVVLDDPNLLLPFTEVQPDYFDVMGIPIVAGRAFATDDTPGAPGAIVISREMAAQLWKGDNPVGGRIRFGASSAWYTVVGIAGDVYQFEHARPRGMFAVYYPLSQSRGIAAQQTIVARTTVPAARVMAAIKQQIWLADPDQPILSMTTIEERYGEFFAEPRFYAALMVVFAVVGLLTAGVGLYGVLAYAIAQRTREFGVRIALGAERRDIMAMVLRTGVGLTAAGLAIGAVASLAATRAIATMLVDVPRQDPLTYAVVIAALAATAILACWLPARRATRVDPVVALRTE